MKFCHIEESGGQQVLFRVNELAIWVETPSIQGINLKVLKIGSFDECLEYFNTLDFPAEAYRFLTEIASGVEYV